MKLAGDGIRGRMWDEGKMFEGEVAKKRLRYADFVELFRCRWAEPVWSSARVKKFNRPIAVNPVYESMS